MTPPTPTPTPTPNRHWIVKRVIIFVAWIICVLFINTFLYDPLDRFLDLLHMGWVKENLIWRWMALFIPPALAFIGVTVLGVMVPTVERHVDTLLQHINAILLFVFLIILAGFAYWSVFDEPPPPPIITATRIVEMTFTPTPICEFNCPSTTSSPTATPTTTLTPLTPSPTATPTIEVTYVPAPSALVALCPKVDDKKTTFNSSIGLLDRYGNLNLEHDVLEKIAKIENRAYGDTSSCKNSLIASTKEKAGLTKNEEIRVDLTQILPIEDHIWIVLAANNTEGIPIGEVIGEVNVKYQGEQKITLTSLRLGENIADWTFEGSTIVDYIPDQNRNAPNYFRIWTGYAKGEGQALGNAAQIFAIRINLEQKPLEYIDISDLIPGNPSINVFAIIHAPQPMPQVLIPPKKDYQSLCLNHFKQANDFQEKRITTMLEKGPYAFMEDCVPTIIPELDPDATFILSKVFETLSTGTHPSIVIPVGPSPVSQIYLLMNARNICNFKAQDMMGEITLIAEDISIPYPLKVGGNIRQGSTNFDNCVSQDDRRAVGELVDIGESGIKARAGVPVRAKRPERVDDAELWLDLVIVDVPEKMRGKPFRIEITDIYSGDKQPYITLYAVTLAIETSPSASR